MFFVSLKCENKCIIDVFLFILHELYCIVCLNHCLLINIKQNIEI